MTESSFSNSPAKSILAAIPLFAGLSEEHLREIGNISARRGYERGQTIFFDGDEAIGLYILLSGQVKIFKTSFDGKEQILHVIAPGEHFAEVPVFDGSKFPANAEAIVPSELLFIDRKALVSLMKKDVSLCMNMLASLSRRLRQFTRQIEMLTLKETKARVAAYLLHVSELKNFSEELDLDVSKSMLANFLGATRESISRMLTKLEESGFIERRGRKIAILDRKSLETIAEQG